MLVVFSKHEVSISGDPDSYLYVWNSKTLVTKKVSHAGLLGLINRLGVDAFSDNVAATGDNQYFIKRREIVSKGSYNSLGWKVTHSQALYGNKVSYNNRIVNLSVGAADTYDLTLRINKKKYVLAHVADMEDLHVDAWVFYCDNILSFSHVELIDDIFILHFDCDYCVAAVDRSGVPLGIFNRDKSTFVADICDKRLVRLSAKMGMLFGDGWWKFLVT